MGNTTVDVAREEGRSRREMEEGRKNERREGEGAKIWNSNKDR